MLLSRMLLSATVAFSVHCAPARPPAALTPLDPEQVEVLMEQAPARDYVTVHRFTLTAGAGASAADLLAEARTRAAALGANAILVARLGTDPAHPTGRRASLGGGTLKEATRPAASFEVSAVVWRCSPP